MVRPHLDIQTHLVCSTKTPVIRGCVPSYGDKWLPIPACSHHLAKKHANLSFPKANLTLSKHDLARFTPVFTRITEVRSRLLCAVRLHGSLQTHRICPTHSSNHRVGSNMAPFAPSYADKWLTRPVCSHHSAQKHANLSSPTVN